MRISSLLGYPCRQLWEHNEYYTVEHKTQQEICDIYNYQAYDWYAALPNNGDIKEMIHE